MDGEEIVHARSTRYGVRTDPLTLYRGKACALLRYNPEAPLRLGMRGLRVQALQKALNARGAKLDVDGIYGRRRPSPATARRSNPCAREGGLDGPPFSLYNGA